MKKNIAIIAGGDSSEIVVSLKSAKGIASFLDSSKYNHFTVIVEGSNWRVQHNDSEIPIDKNDFSFLLDGEKITFDCAYITIHGTPGENGVLQGYFHMIGLPHTTCDVLPSAMTFDKFTCNNYLKNFGVKVAESVMVKKGQHPAAVEIIGVTGLPVFVKPNAGGSSFGVTKVTEKAQLIPAIEKAQLESDVVIIESYIQGTEVTNGIYKTLDKAVVLPITEVVPKNEFFDYEAKYEGAVEEITPARISDELTNRIQTLTSAIYDILGCKGIVRIDYIIKENSIYLLEVNTTPGMTATSFIPQQIEAAQLPIADVFTEIIEDSIRRLG